MLLLSDRHFLMNPRTSDSQALATVVQSKHRIQAINPLDNSSSGPPQATRRLVHWLLAAVLPHLVRRRRDLGSWALSSVSALRCQSSSNLDISVINNHQGRVAGKSRPGATCVL